MAQETLGNLAKDMKDFLMSIQKQFPKINGVGIGSAAGENLRFVVLLERDLSSDEREEITSRFVEKFLEFKKVGKIRPL